MNILGISALYHDAAACLVIDGKIIAAAQEERFTRIKHDPSFPAHAIKYCLETSGLKQHEIDIVVFYDNPLYTLDRYIKNIAMAGKDSKDVINRSFESMFSEKLWIHKKLEALLGANSHRKFLICEHHISHAASAFYPSPYEKAVVLTL
ncbi:carbamoyltransferase N-terminal domain-containing protein, partial [Bacteroides congonensis]|uniref:carbamoyltransferase N-terminal domain-containing protein n=1 Tax=Bacteroides congonensis TaxID=1871006 RepID=UPI00321A2416